MIKGLLSKPSFFNPWVAAVIVAVMQTAILGYMIESRASILREGKDVVLKTVPVDPRDLLRGDYVVLSYEISSIPFDKLVDKPPTEEADAQLSVRLSQGADGFWTVAEAAFGALEARDDGTVIAKSQPFYFYPQPGNVEVPLSVEYGIERYYVPEGEGKVLEEARNAQALSVAARVDTAGRMQIRTISIDGKPLDEEPLY
ncbi:putative membrane-anchored protein [Pararhizobium capsulatum DSM 1112]|uniref:Membrane-anchored protein n=1 Tax=Pararhizobium capsulatum DSM 1112 TaxID=1121113 RepID=A0ABU0BPN4_9HYPH|nr:GDYXXLXY domain-containing protein [Pararhizobium capsulatum]MDQ0320217.1 putative membrane-anchored protein [Pararhizobium capsulatum DSM 1112]